MISTCLEQSYFQDYKDGIVLKFVENTVWSALSFRERKLILFKVKLKSRKGLLKKKKQETYQVSVIRSLAFIFSVRMWKDMSKRHTHSFSGFNKKKKKQERHIFKNGGPTPDITPDMTHSTRHSIIFSPGPCLRLAGLIFRENGFFIFLFFFYLIRKWIVLTKAARTKLTFSRYRCRIRRILPFKNKKRSNRKLL